MGRTRYVTLASLLAACTAVLAQVVVPLGPVPFNLAVLGAFLAGILLPPTWAGVSMAVYLALGACGVPVFAGFQGGIGVLLGNTGGFALGYLCIAVCTAEGQKQPQRAVRAAFAAIGLCLCYALGTLWFCLLTGTALQKALWVCVLPFVLPDFAKSFGAAALGKALKRRLHL